MDSVAAGHVTVRALARDIVRCAELEAVLDGRAGPCREVVGWQGLTPAARWYVPEPWAGHIGAAAILFVSSNPSAGPRGERFDPARHMSRRDSDEHLFAAADGAFDDLRFPGIAGGGFNRDRSGRRTGREVPFWRWTQGIARELLGREPTPGNDYALTEVVHCGSQSETGVAAALGTCTSRFLRRVLAASPAGVVVVVGATARGAFEGQLRAQFTGSVQHLSRSAWFWRRGELLGRTRYVLTLPHPNARVPAHGVAGNLGPQLTAELRTFLRSWTPQAATASTAAPPEPPRAAAAPAHRSLAAAPGRTRAADSGPPRSSRVFAITTRKRDRNGDPSLMPGLNYVVAAVRTPWEPGAVRVIHVTGTDPRWRVGQLVDLANASTGLRLGQYEVIAGHSGKSTIWDLP